MWAAFSMRHPLLLFLVISISIFPSGYANEYDELISTPPEYIAEQSLDEDQLIYDVFSPFSGQPSLGAIDLVAKGAQNISLARIYIPPHIPVSFHSDFKHDQQHLYTYAYRRYQGWTVFPHQQIMLKGKNAKITTPQGITLEVKIPPRGGRVNLVGNPFGINNYSHDEVSGKYDLRNIAIEFADQKHMKVTFPSGSICYYRKLEEKSTIFILEREQFPNGKNLFYFYQKGYLSRVESRDPKNLYTYASIEISPQTESCTYKTNLGLEASYDYEIRKKADSYRINGEKIKYSSSSRPILKQVKSPFYLHETMGYCDRFLLESYSGKDDIFTCTYKGFGSNQLQFNRIHTISKPVGKDDISQTLCEVEYQLPDPGKKKGVTTVNYKDGRKTVYNISKNILLSSIQYYSEGGSLKKEKLFFWRDEDNRLAAIEWRDGSEKTLLKRSYDQYDSYGNPGLETITGDIQGHGQNDTYSIRRTFSQDGLNLLIAEEYDDRPSYYFTYLPNTNLVTSKLTKGEGKILLREFFTYDEHCNLKTKLTDDGSSEDKNNLADVTTRTWTNYCLRQQAPFLHMPEWIEEMYLEDGQEKVLRRTHLTYDAFGNVEQEDVYDEKGVFAYSVSKTYNERGDITSETNPIGKTATYKFDEKGRCYEENPFSNKLNIKREFNARNSVKIETRTSLEDKHEHIRSFDHDANNRITQEIDLYGNAKLYTYDLISNKIKKTEYPPIFSDGETIPVIESSVIDSFGREISKTDPNGNTTTANYNAYGDPVEILYPNGGRELFRYEKNGRLKTHTDQEGITTTYSYDALGKVKEKTYSNNTVEHAKETFVYRGFNLSKETDKAGHETHYFYDGAGRKIREERCGKITEWVYDSLGRVETIKYHNDRNTLYVTHKMDFLDRIHETIKSNSKGDPLYKISYTYDDMGNRDTITRYFDQKESLTSVETFKYDPFNRLIEHTDGCGHMTKRVYKEKVKNEIGQHVLEVTTTDPVGTCTIETKDSLGNLVKKEMRNNNEKVLSLVEMSYDPCGNLLQHTDHLYENGICKSKQTLKYSYDIPNRIETYTRAFNTPEARTTTLEYTFGGKIAAKTLPDKHTLHYSYDHKGDLKTLTSDDETINHQFEYNVLGHLTSAKDLNEKISIQRTVDPFGNVQEETFSGITITKTYDKLDRPRTLTIPNYGHVCYEYDPVYLRSVKKTSSQDVEQYVHSYEQYNLNGDVMREVLPNLLGVKEYSYDLNGRIASIQSPTFTETYSYDAQGNLFQKVHNTQESLFEYDDLSQLTSEKGSTVATYNFDSHYNLTKKNGVTAKTNDLNELLSCGNIQCEYDLKGNMYEKRAPEGTSNFFYDHLNRLIKITKKDQTITFKYDPLGRRLSKTVQETKPNQPEKLWQEHYLYDGKHEIGALENGELKQFRVLNPSDDKFPDTVAIELDRKPYFSICDAQGNIRQLIDPLQGDVEEAYSYSSFGKELQPNSHTLANPWRYASKRLDPELNIIYFGMRYYDSDILRWLTTDPAGFTDSTNLYQYDFNNPYRYRDPDGKFIFALPIVCFCLGESFAVISLSTIATYAAQAALTAAVVWAGTEVGKAINNWDRNNVLNNTDQSATETSQDEATGKKKGKNREATSSQSYKPPYCGQELGDDPTKCPAEGFKWQGKDAPGGKRGNWYNPETEESLHPDLDHPPPIKPHWDYQSPDFSKGFRLNTDGTWDVK